MTTPLSPAAQAVLDPFASQMEGEWISPDFIPYEAKKIAGAIRAAADQVVPIARTTNAPPQDLRPAILNHPSPGANASTGQ
jgi:hypothetical protein